MRYTATPSNFPVAYWKELWQNNIDDTEQLQTLASTRGVVAIDIDPYISDGQTTHEGITEFGISFLPPIASDALLCLPSPPSLDALVQHFTIQSDNIRVAHRQRTERHRETYRFGSQESQVVAADQVEDAALAIIRSFTREGDPKPLLAGFSLGYEFKVLTKFYPRLLTQCFSAWVDVQEVVNDICTSVHQRPIRSRSNKAAYPPGMRDTLFALGYHRDGLAIVGPKDEHSAGNDAVRVLAVLLGLLGLPRPQDGGLGPVLEIKRWGKKLYEKVECGPGLISRKYWRSKPEPPELFPYMARLEHQGASLPAGFRAQSLYKTFAHYEPLAAGMSTEAGGTCCYLCLPTAETLQRFLAEINGHTAKQLGNVVWTATPERNEAVTPLREMKDFVENMKRRQFSEEAQSKRLERENRKVERKHIEDSLDDTVGGMSLVD